MATTDRHPKSSMSDLASNTTIYRCGADIANGRPVSLDLELDE
jgi:hypothetical protein